MERKSHDKIDESEDDLGYDDASGPSEDEIEAWAVAEKKRREAWLAGPTDEEKRTWARRERLRRRTLDPEVERTAKRLYRETELAGMGLLYALTWAPFDAFARLIRLGADWEEGFSRPSRSPRVPFDDV